MYLENCDWVEDRSELQLMPPCLSLGLTGVCIYAACLYTPALSHVAQSR